MKIVPLRAVSAEALAPVHAEAFDEERWDAAQIAGSLALSSTGGFAAVEGGTVLGFLMTQHMQGEAEILTLGVALGARRRGIAGELLKALIHQSDKTRLFLEVAADNVPAIALYEKAGFRRMGLRKAYYKRANGRVDALTYCFSCCT